MSTHAARWWKSHYPAVISGSRRRAAAAGGGGTTLLTDLYGYWNLTESSGTRADGTANALTLTDNNTVTGQAAGGPGGQDVSQFTLANSEFLSRNSETALQTGDIAWAFACWVYLDAVGANRGIAGKGTLVGGFEWWLGYTHSATNFQFTAASTLVSATSLGAPSTSTWYFIVVEHDPTANTVSIQVNDGTIDSASTGGNAGASNALVFAIGRVSQLSPEYMDGRMAMCGFWKRALTTQERTTLYASGAGLAYAQLT